jgi:hypothetical protein
MLELCPRGMAFFCYLFLQWLTWEIQVLLSHTNSANVRAITEKADSLMVLNKPQSHETMVAAITTATAAEGEETVAAVSEQQCRRFKKLKKAAKKQHGGGSSDKRSSLCFFHAK